MKSTKFDDIVAAVLAVLPNAVFEKDTCGQIVIYTNCEHQVGIDEDTDEEVTYLVPIE